MPGFDVMQTSEARQCKGQSILELALAFPPENALATRPDGLFKASKHGFKRLSLHQHRGISISTPRDTSEGYDLKITERNTTSRSLGGASTLKS